MKKFIKFLVWLLVVAYVAFIFSNSLMDGLESSAFSYKVANGIAKILENHGISIQMTLFHAWIRKVAHFTEFFGLGFMVALAIYTCPLFKSRLINFVLFLIAIPTIDETIQYFVPDRASAFTDVVIDFSGMLCGGLVLYILYLIIKDISQSLNKHKQIKTM